MSNNFNVVNVIILNVIFMLSIVNVAVNVILLIVVLQDRKIMLNQFSCSY